MDRTLLVALPKSMVKELEKTTVPVENFIHQDQTLFEKYMQVIGWYHTHGLTTQDTNKQHIQKLMYLLGIAPAYHVSYEFRFAVWGFSFKKDGHKEQDFIMYYSNQKGLVIQIAKKFRKELIPYLIDELHRTLVNGSTR